MAEENKEKQGTSKRIMENRIYFMGKKGGLTVEVKQFESKPPFLKISKWHEKGKTTWVNINKEIHWLKIKRVVDSDFAEQLGWAGFSLPETDQPQFISVREHDAQVKKLQKVIKNKSTEVREMEKNLSRIRRNMREELEKKFKTRLPEHKKTLSEYKKKIDAGTGERELHTFLKENFWIFGMHYTATSSQAKIGFRHRGDFLLQRDDGYFDIVEIKSPKDDVFTRYEKLSPTLKDAISQMMIYLHKCDILYSTHITELKRDILKPKGIIVVGMKSKESTETKDDITMTVEENLRVHNSFLNNIQIITFDQLYDNVKHTINKFELIK